MKNKKGLAKIALTALVLASATPVTGHADMEIEAQGILLAAGCPAHGCANASAPANPMPAFNPNSRDYSGQPYGGAPVGTPPGGYTGSPSGAGGPPPGYRGPATGGYNNPAGSYNNYGNPSSGYNAQPGAPAYREDYRGASYGSMSGTSEYGMTGSNRGNVTDANYDYNAAAGTASSATLTEAQLTGMLSPQGRAIYASLDPEAKALALQLASQDSYRDKNLAVKEAQRRMNERRGFNR
jgi:hypothetical protein